MRDNTIPTLVNMEKSPPAARKEMLAHIELQLKDVDRRLDPRVSYSSIIPKGWICWRSTPIRGGCCGTFGRIAWMIPAATEDRRYMQYTSLDNVATKYIMSG